VSYSIILRVSCLPFFLYYPYLLSRYDLTLEELFLEADRIGNKYLTEEEIQDFHQKLAKELNEIAEEIDKQFPDTEIEVIDFSKNAKSKPIKNRNYKTYKTTKL